MSSGTSLMNKPIVARAVTTIHASISNVWNALVDPAVIKQYMQSEKSWNTMLASLKRLLET